MVAEEAVEPRTPEPEATTDDPITPHNLRILRSNSRAVRQGKMDPTKALLKAEKSLERLLAQNVLQEKEIASMRAAQRLDRATRGSRKTQRFPTGQLFDPTYQVEHEQELAGRKEQEREARDKRRRIARQERQGYATNRTEEP